MEGLWQASEFSGGSSLFFMAMMGRAFRDMDPRDFIPGLLLTADTSFLTPLHNLMIPVHLPTHSIGKFPADQ